MIILSQQSLAAHKEGAHLLIEFLLQLEDVDHVLGPHQVALLLDVVLDFLESLFEALAKLLSYSQVCEFVLLDDQVELVQSGLKLGIDRAVEGFHLFLRRRNEVIDTLVILKDEVDLLPQKRNLVFANDCDHLLHFLCVFYRLQYQECLLHNSQLACVDHRCQVIEEQLDLLILLIEVALTKYLLLVPILAKQSTGRPLYCSQYKSC